MKKLIVLFIVILSASIVFGQGLLKVLTGANIKTINGSHIVLNNTSLVNDGTIQQANNQGVFDFTGNNNDTISGTGILLFDRINMAKNNNAFVTLQRNTKVGNQLVFNGGIFNLNNYILDLSNTGVLVNESENTRAFTIGTGYIQSTGILNNPSLANPGNLGAVITSSINLGNTIIRRGHKVQQNVFGNNNSIERFYDIIPANNSNLNATLQLSYFDAELNSIDEAGLNMWISANNVNWTAVCDFIRNTSNNYVQSNGINSFGRWTLSQETPPLIAGIPDVYAVNPGGAANTIYIGYGPSSVTLNAQVTGGAPPYSYKWTIGSNAGPPISSNPSFTVSPTATTTYYLNVKDAFGCSVAFMTKQITVTDIRCGAKLDKVTVCKLQNGKYTATCVNSGSVAGLLASGSYLGECSTPLTLASSEQTNELTVAAGLEIRAYPNPSAKYFNLIIESSNKEQAINLSVFSSNGALIETRNNLSTGKIIGVGQEYLPGLYLLKIVQGKESKVIKLIKM